MTKSFAPSKKAVRADAKLRIASLSPAVRRQLDLRIHQTLLSLPEFRAALQVLAYLPLPDEPSISAVLIEAMNLGKRVYMPLTDARWHLRYVRWTPADGTRTSAYAQWRTSSEEEPTAVASLVLIPGMAFDRTGFRVGRGKGCYDRSMDGLSALGPTVGIAYDVQVWAEIPREAHDRPVDIVLTEQEIIRTPRDSKGEA